ncbi:hypothetical protein ACHAPX_010604, partial [Trichoderma viride]
MAKPLLSRLVIPEPTEVVITPKTSKSTARKKKEVSFIEFNTPQRSQDVRNIINSININSPRTRLLLRKVGKQLDRKNTTEATAEAKIRNLQRQVNSFRPKKKSKVEENPNSRFIRIEEIMATKRKLEEERQRAEASNEA